MDVPVRANTMGVGTTWELAYKACPAYVRARRFQWLGCLAHARKFFFDAISERTKPPGGSGDRSRNCSNSKTQSAM